MPSIFATSTLSHAESFGSLAVASLQVASKKSRKSLILRNLPPPHPHPPISHLVCLKGALKNYRAGRFRRNRRRQLPNQRKFHTKPESHEEEKCLSFAPFRSQKIPSRFVNNFASADSIILTPKRASSAWAFSCPPPALPLSV